MKYYGRECKYNALVIDLLGKSLEYLFRRCASHFAMKTVLLLADQMISLIETVHSKSYIHGDIKPAPDGHWYAI